MIFNLANNLEQYNLDGWHVTKKIPQTSSTGGNFSICYEAQHDDGRKGFLKALDYSRAFQGPNATEALQVMLSAYNFEKDLLQECLNKKMRYVVKIIGAGSLILSPEQFPQNALVLYPRVDYIVMECADKSLRNIIDLSEKFDLAWALRSLHNIATGILELHRSQIAHQDIKPSNILVFTESNASKLGDVGRSSSMAKQAPHDILKIAGDPSYAPFEQRYGETPPDWYLRRIGCDMFMFGNLIMLYFNNITLSAAVYQKLSPSQKPGKWTDGYQTVLPFIESAVSESLESFNRHLDNDLRNELVQMVRELCNPNPERRGDIARSHLKAQQYSMERYVSRLDYWAKKYELSFKQVVK